MQWQFWKKKNEKRPEQDREESFIGSPKIGKHLFFQECAGCHELGEGSQLEAPPLRGIIGMKIASTSYAYSKGMRKQHHLVWTVQKMDEFLRNPKRSIPDNKMVYHGLRDAAQRAHIIAYLIHDAQNFS